jgi:hypothetical protein
VRRDVTLPQKAELEALEQQRGGVDRESALLTEEVQFAALRIKLRSHDLAQVMRIKAEVGQYASFS